MLKIVHPVAGLIAVLTIATFWLSTALSELFGSEAAVVAVKTAVPWGLFILIPALAATGGSGFAWSKGQRQGLVGTKLKRMPFIAVNGIVVLIPAALFLASKARVGEFDTTFYIVQALELIAGATNITLLGLAIRDGMKLTKWRRGSFLKRGVAYTTSLIGKENVARGTLAIHLKKPEGFAFKAGQAVYVTLPGLKEADGKGRVRTFSIASAPDDADLVIATRLTDSALKRGLASLPVGSAVEIEGPYGDLTLHGDAARPAVFLAGGMGITPFRSMIRDAATHARARNLILFYSNRSAEDAAFLSELEQTARENPGFKLVATMTDAGDWQGERGFITREMIERHLGDIASPVFCLAGPPAMVAAMETLLKAAGVKAENVRVEVFAGY
ncbi:ferredoxin--NADP reductase [Mesorhizobium humile]|uniref:FAD-dependent oxidoreductase n=1 Tax=Mesorhizobium humile TaxID=3072313 RepID=A0ABU4YNN2_9HYPH|nr:MULTISPECIES: FAD-dependent oxidoreductase [unclassified Mesorhizobium]MDX8462236.1 FAD-dependent oxidoreductase [Mesorhizobium sp. VK2D]MDX8487509.1 FAD-dependent oxidoreductase [Mesorhizobium sp. VK2B]